MSRYGWSPPHLPAKCICGKDFSVEHTLSCPTGAFPSIRHNDVGDLTAKLITEVCHNVEVEPALQPLTGESLSSCGAKVLDLISVYRRSGVKGIKVHFSMFRFLTHSHKILTDPRKLQPIDNMKQ